MTPPDFPLLLDDVIDPVAVVNEYRRLCDAAKLPEGTSLRDLMDFAWRQGAQFRELTPDLTDRPHDVFEYLRRSAS